jgi:hypothetical protein
MDEFAFVVEPIVIGTHEYEWALHVFAGLFAKYCCDVTVTYIGDRVEGTLPSNIRFEQVPCYSEGIWPWKNWFGNGLTSIFERYVGSLVLLMLPDHWIYEPVDMTALYAMMEYMWQRYDIVRGSVTSGLPVFKHGHVIDNVGDYDIYTVSPSNPDASIDGGITFCPSIWRPELAMELFDPNWTIQKCETLGTARMAADTCMRSVSICPGPVTRANVLCGTKPNTVNVSKIPAQDRPLVMEHRPQHYGIIY